MKKSFALVLVSALLTCSLAGCGTEDQNQTNQGTEADRPPVTESQKPAADSQKPAADPQDRNRDGVRENDRRDGGMMDDLESGIRNGVDDVRDGVEDVVDPQDQTPGKVGKSYDQMVENGKVHDNDGRLKDHETADKSGPVRAD